MCFVLDAYVEVENSRCLRTEQDSNGVRKLISRNAKDECSKNMRCVGIEPFDGQQYRGRILFKLCLDAIYTTTPQDRYRKLTNKVFKKKENYGTYTAHEVTYYLIIRIELPTSNFKICLFFSFSQLVLTFN